jgi:nitroreductase
MDIFTAIETRRSVRQYTGEQIDESKIIEALRYAMYAPSAHNSRSWRFILTSNKEHLIKISQIHPYAKMLPNASWAVLFCNDMNAENTEGYAALNVSASVENFLLAIHGMGYGAVWLGIYPRKERMNALKDFFDLPDYLMPIALCSVGVPKLIPPQPDRFEPEKILKIYK